MGQINDYRKFTITKTLFKVAPNNKNIGISTDVNLFPFHLSGKRGKCVSTFVYNALNIENAIELLLTVTLKARNFSVACYSVFPMRHKHNTHALIPRTKEQNAIGEKWLNILYKVIPIWFTSHLFIHFFIRFVYSSRNFFIFLRQVELLSIIFIG